MKRFASILILSGSLLLCGCQNEANPDSMPEETEEEITGEVADLESEAAEESSENQSTYGEVENSHVVQRGPYGTFSIVLPKDWNYEVCPVDSGGLVNGMYGIRFYPEGVDEGYVEVVYDDSFGVCGTGLSTEETVIGRHKVSIGTYDNHEYWNYISFQEDYAGVVALTYSVDGWWSQYGEEVWGVLHTLIFDSTIKEGGAYVYSQESEAEEIALYLSLKDITPTGVTLVFHQYDKEAPTGELDFGAAYTIERLKDGNWEELPGPVEGSEDENYAFNDVAYIIKPESETEKEVDWEWLHGPLSPGEYRIKKTVHDFRETGDFDEYTVYAQFILN